MSTSAGVPAVQVTGLRKSFRVSGTTVEAVRGIDLTVPAGEIFGLLGPNGAGKTTTLRILTTLLPADSGAVSVAGADVLRSPAAVRRRIGYVGQLGGADKEATGRENLTLAGRLYGLSATGARRRCAELGSVFDLDAILDRSVRTYSGGQRRRLEVALGIMHRPQVLFLDEPTTGLDPQSRSNMWQHIRRLRSDLGTTVFLTTHYLDEADALCDRLFVIDHGVIVAAGTPDELKRRVSGDVVTLSVNGAPDHGATGAARPLLAASPVTREITETDGTLRLTVDHGEEALPVLLRTLDGAGITMSAISLSRPTLDDVFLTLTGRSLRDDSPGAAGAAGPAAGGGEPELAGTGIGVKE